MNKHTTKYFEWTVNYGVYSAGFSVFSISLEWIDSGYMPRVNGKNLLKKSVSFEAAEYAVVMYLQKITEKINNKFPIP